MGEGNKINYNVLTSSQYIDLEKECIVLNLFLYHYHNCIDQNILISDDFAYRETQSLFKQMIDMRSKVENTPLILIQDYSEHAYDLFDQPSMSPSMFDGYQRLIKKLSLKRMIEEALRSDKDTSVYQSALDKLYAKEEPKVHTAKLVEDMWKNDGKIRGVGTGFNLLNDSILGFENGRVYTVAARAGLGKTSLACNFMYNQLGNAQKVCFFSLEMDKTEMCLKLASIRLEREVKRIKQGNIAEEEKQLCTRFLSYLDNNDNLNIYTSVDVRNINDICLRARELKKAGKLQIIYVDHIGLCKDTSQRFQSRNYEIESISNKLKMLAQELDVPVVMVCQINRGVESRDNKRPAMSDLRDSGAIEQDSDVVMILYRPYYYLSTMKSDKPDQQALLIEKAEASKNKSEVIIAKNRQGNTSVVPLYVNTDCMKFFDAPTEEMVRADEEAQRKANLRKSLEKTK